jgi:predicted nucleotidyltransferase
MCVIESSENWTTMITTEIAEKLTILKVRVGSHIHGLNVSTSDEDVEAIIIEPIESAMGLGNPFEELIRNGPDIKWISLRKWTRLACKGNPNFLLLLFAPLESIIKSDARGSQLRDLASSFVSKQAIKSHLGYMQGQRGRMMNQFDPEANSRRGRGQHRPDPAGFDTKFAMHLLRLGMQGVELMKTGRLQLPMEEEARKYLMRVRSGEVPIEEVLKLSIELEQTMKDQWQTSSLPEEPDYETVEKFMVQCYIRSWAAGRHHQDLLENMEIFARNESERMSRMRPDGT